MPQIVNIKIIKGRRAEAIEQENVLRKIAEELYSKWKKESYNHSGSIEDWAHTTYGLDERYKKLYERPRSAFNKEPADITRPEKKPEVSIEQQILDLIKYGWEMKDGLILDNDPTIGQPYFCQTMVLYEGITVTITEDLLA